MMIQSLNTSRVPFGLRTIRRDRHEQLLDRYMELKPLKTEYDQLHKQLRTLFDGVERRRVGKYVVTGKRVQQPAKKVGAFSYWQYDVQRRTPQSTMDVTG